MLTSALTVNEKEGCLPAYDIEDLDWDPSGSAKDRYWDAMY